MKRIVLIISLLAVIILLAVVITSSAVFCSQRLSINVSVNRSSVFVGEPVIYSVAIRTGKDFSIQLTNVEEAFEGFTVKDGISRDIPYLWTRLIRKEYVLKRFEVGDYTIPGLTAKYRRGDTGQWREKVTREIDIKVRSLLPEDFDERPKKIRVEGGRIDAGRTGRVDITAEPGSVQEIEAPVRFPIKEVRGPRDVMILKGLLLKAGAGLLIIVLVLLGFIVYRVRAGRKVRISSPQGVAIKKLQALKDKGLWEKGRQKEFCSELFFIMINYARDRFNIRSAEMTTEELIREIDAVEGLEEKDKRYLTELIEVCGFIKYTAYVPEEKQKALDIESALKFVRGTASESEEDTSRGS